MPPQLIHLPLALALPLTASAALGQPRGATYRVMPGSVAATATSQVPADFVLQYGGGAYVLSLQLTDRCAAELGDLTARHLGQLVTLEFAPGVSLTVQAQTHVTSRTVSIRQAATESDAIWQKHAVLEAAGPTGEPPQGACFSPVQPAPTAPGTGDA